MDCYSHSQGPTPFFLSSSTNLNKISFESIIRKRNAHYSNGNRISNGMHASMFYGTCTAYLYKLIRGHSECALHVLQLNTCFATHIYDALRMCAPPHCKCVLCRTTNACSAARLTVWALPHEKCVLCHTTKVCSLMTHCECVLRRTTNACSAARTVWALPHYKCVLCRTTNACSAARIMCALPHYKGVIRRTTNVCSVTLQRRALPHYKGVLCHTTNFKVCSATTKVCSAILQRCARL
jgi:hypothetical protein